MTESEVKELMESSKSELEWKSNCKKVISRCDGYPDFWFRLIIQSGLIAKVTQAYESK